MPVPSRIGIFYPLISPPPLVKTESHMQRAQSRFSKVYFIMGLTKVCRTCDDFCQAHDSLIWKAPNWSLTISELKFFSIQTPVWTKGNLEKEVGDYTQYIKRLLKVILNIANNLHKINAKMK